MNTAAESKAGTDLIIEDLVRCLARDSLGSRTPALHFGLKAASNLYLAITQWRGIPFFPLKSSLRQSLGLHQNQ